MICTHSVTQKNNVFLAGDVPDDGCKVLVEQVFCVRCGGQCWGIYTLIRGDWACGGVKAESQEALGAASAWLIHSQQAVPHCKSYSVLSGLARALPLPEECVVLLPQGTRVCKSCLPSFSLLSSSLMTVVFLESLMSCRLFPRVLLLKPFPKKSNCKATVIIARWPPLAPQNRRSLTDLVLSPIWVSSHPPHNLPCEKWWGCRFSRRQLDPLVGSAGLQVTSRKSIRPDPTCSSSSLSSSSS